MTTFTSSRHPRLPANYAEHLEKHLPDAVKPSVWRRVAEWTVPAMMGGGDRGGGLLLPMNKLNQNQVTHPQIVDVPQPLEIHPSVSQLAAELLMKTVEQLMAEPASYSQMRPDHTCGSPCCITGHMARAAGITGYCGDWEKIGLTKTQYDRLFHASCWPTKLMQRINPGYIPNSGSYKFPASFGVARCEYMLSTGE